EEAALSDTARAPRASLAGADDRRARPGPGHRDGGTVHFQVAMSEQEALEIIRQSAERWNAGDFEGMFELYADDLVVVTGEHWPEANLTMEGKDAFRESTREWLDVWQSVELETDHVEAFGDRVVAQGHWRSTGR